MLNVPQGSADRRQAPAEPVSELDRRRILSLSDERARARDREAAVFRAGYLAGLADAWPRAWEAGYRESERDDWQVRRTAVERVLHPEQEITRRVQAAEAHARREAAAHWRAFTAAAWAAPDRARTPVQRAVVRAGLAGGTR